MIIFPLSEVAKTSVRVKAPIFLLCTLSFGAMYNQFIINPESVAGNNQIAGKPHKYAAPLTPRSVHAEEELADALSAATQGPSFLPPRI